MKKKLSILLASLLLLASCSGNPGQKQDDPGKKQDDPVVEHIYATTWSSDATNHWHACTENGCTEKSDVAAHQFGDWTIDTYATKDNSGSITKGSKHRNCTVCNYKEEQQHEELDPNASTGHQHTWDTAWSSDATYHWHKCTGKIQSSGSSSGWSWGGSSSQSCTEVNDKAAHTFDEGKITTAATAYSEGVKTYTCSVCKYTKTESIPAGGGAAETKGNFTFNNDITTAQEIHTADQKKFLNLGVDYYNITSTQLNGCNAKGTAENSFPKQVKLTWNHTAPAGKTVTKYSVYTGQKADLSDGYMIQGTTAKEISFYNAFLGVNYFKVLANFSDGSYEVSDIKTFLVDEQAPRNLKVGTMSNCRDMGGRPTVAGGKIKQGLIYRTSDPATSGVGDVSEWTKRFKIKTEIYVKDGSTSSGPLGSSVKFVNASMDYGATPYSNWSRNAERLRKVFSVLGDANNYPLMYHCRIGTDRTGICGVAINGLLGVSFNECVADHAFSNFGKIDGQRYAHKTPDSNGDDIAKYIDEILAMPGKNFQEQTYNALLACGIPASTLNFVIDFLTEGTKATLPTNTTVVMGDKLTNNGGSKKTATDYTHPDNYIEISSGKSVSTSLNLTEGKKVTVVAYVGCTDSSSSKKLASGLALKIDDATQTIVDKTYQKAGFGTTQQARRTGYMFEVLGSYNLAAGNHTFTLAGNNSDKFNVGAITLIVE